MNRTEYEFSINWLAGLGSGWLFLLLPLGVALLCFLYLPQLRRVGRASRWILLSLRLLFVVVALLLAFRPQIEVVRKETFGGRYLVVVDDSPSMQLSGRYWPETVLEALDLRLHAPGSHGDPAGAMTSLALVVRELQDLQEPGFLHGSDYWDTLDATRAQNQEVIDAVQSHLAETHPEFTQEVAFLFAPAAADEGAVKARTTNFLSFLAARLEETASETGQVVALSESAVGSETTRVKISRELLREVLEEQIPGVAPGQVLEVSPESSVSDAVLQALQKEDRQPLDGVIVLTDGISLGKDPLQSGWFELLRNQSIPIYVVAVGDTAEPPDAGVLALQISSTAFADQPMPYRMTIKSSGLEEGEHPQRVLFLVGEEELLSVPLPATEGVFTLHGFLEQSLPPRSHTLSVEMEIQDEEITPDNNRLEAPIFIRAEPYRVMYWETSPSWWGSHLAHTAARIPWVEFLRADREGSERLDPESADSWIFSFGPGATPETVATMRQILESGAGKPAVLLGEVPDSFLPETVSDAPLPPLEQWRRTPSGAAGALTSGWNELAVTQDGDEFIPTDNEIWLATESGEPIWGWRSTQENPLPTLFLRFADKNEPAPAEREAEFAATWNGMWEWLAGLDATGAEVLMPQRIPAGTPFLIHLRNITDQTPVLRNSAGEPIEPLRIDQSPVGPWKPFTYQISDPGTYHLHTGEDVELGVPLTVVADSERLGRLARRDDVLREMTVASQGAFTPFFQADAILPWLRTSSNVSVQRFLFQPWSSPWSLLVLLGFLLAEWILRKRRGLL